MVVVSALALIFVKTAFVASTRSHLIQKCKHSCAASKWCETGQEGVFSYACHRQTQRGIRTPGTDPAMKCRTCKSILQSSELQPRREEKEDEKSMCQKKKNVTPRRRGYRKLTAGKATIALKKYEVKKTWEEALKQCRSDGGTLVTMYTRQKYLAVSKFASVMAYWTGLKDLYDNDTFFWTDGKPLTFSRWENGEPHHRAASGKNENCAGFRGPVFPYDGGLFDCQCDALIQFMCEMQLC